MPAYERPVSTWETGCCPTLVPDCMTCGTCPENYCLEPEYLNPAEARSYFNETYFREEDRPALLHMIGGVSRIFDDACELPHGSFRIAPENPYLIALSMSDAELVPLPFHVPGSLCEVGLQDCENVYRLPGNVWRVTRNRYLQLDPDRCLEAGCNTYRDFGLTALVCARWGWLTTPQDVKQAVAEYLAQVFRRRDPQIALQQGLNGMPLTQEEAPLSWKMAVRRYRSEACKLRGARFA